MKIIAPIIAGIALTAHAMALEVVYMGLENNQGNAENAVALTTQLEASRTLTVPLDQIDQFIANPDNGLPDRIVELPPNLGRVAIENGWVPTHHLNTVVAMGFYTTPDRVGGPFKRITSSPRNTLSYDAAEALKDPDAEHFQAKNHFSCLRRIFSGDTDACVTASGIARRYAARFGVEVVLSGEAIAFDPVGLYASPGVTPAQMDVIKDITVKMPRGTQFEPL